MFKIILSFIATSALVYAAGIPSCLYCKQMDTYSGMFYSYNFCKSNNKCTLEAWNKPNLYCDVAWVDGYTLDLDMDCDAGIAICQPFVSSSAYSNKNLTGTRTLQAGEMCTISIDAKAYPARIMFDKNDNLGVMYNGYQTGRFLSIPQGSTLDLTIYNGK